MPSLRAIFRRKSPPRDFDEEWYLGANPDVAAAVSSNMFRSGREHYVRHGRFEGRPGSLLVRTPGLVPLYIDLFQGSDTGALLVVGWIGDIAQSCDAIVLSNLHLEET